MLDRLVFTLMLTGGKNMCIQHRQYLKYRQGDENNQPDTGIITDTAWRKEVNCQELPLSLFRFAAFLPLLMASVWRQSTYAVHRPDILLILADDQSRPTLGCHGDEGEVFSVTRGNQEWLRDVQWRLASD